MDYAVNNYSEKKIVIDDSIFNGKKVIVEKGYDKSTGVECDCIKPNIDTKYKILLKENEDISYEIKLNKKVIAPIKKGQIIGYIKLYIDNNEYKTIYIKALNNIEKITYVKKITELLHFFTRGYVDIKNN